MRHLRVASLVAGRAQDTGYHVFIILHECQCRRKPAVSKYLWEGREIVIVFLSQKLDSLSPTI